MRGLVIGKRAFVAAVLLALAMLVIGLGGAGQARAGDMPDKGLEIILQVKVDQAHAKGQATPEEIVEQVERTIGRRLRLIGLPWFEVEVTEPGRLRVRLPQLKDPRPFIDLVVKVGRLEFRLVKDINPGAKKWQNPPPDAEVMFMVYVDRKAGQMVKRPVWVAKETLLSSAELDDAEMKMDAGRKRGYVLIKFTGKGAKIFGRITAENVKKYLAIIIDGRIVSAPMIQEAITGGQARIAGRFSPATADILAVILRSGPLAAPVLMLAQRDWKAK